ncbi:threonine aldolase [Nitzschia inconspicua]|uniref:Threonine aldolase n=1 Tax=Nitzschia inconspicua TaxID=303405 RepID=A0A9K3Q8Q1_9STRA|nr:threonine aldolase [Nitzschia inconspicua]
MINNSGANGWGPQRIIGIKIEFHLFFISLLLFGPNLLFLDTEALTVTCGESDNSIRLQTPHPDLTPAERLHELAAILAHHGIDEWDVYGDFHKSTADNDHSFLRNFEAEVANEFGKDDAVFMPSGVMAQSIALLIHYQDQQQRGTPKKKCFACHPTSHLLLHEEKGFKELCGFDAIPIHSSNHDNIGVGLGAPPMLLEHLQKTDLDDVSTLILELPHRELGGKLTPWEDVLQIQQRVRNKGTAFHCDGARIFEATAGYQQSLAELAEPFDSFYISFYKGLGGMSGAMLMGTSEFCDQARVWLRRFGGNLFTLLPYVASAWVGYQRHWKLMEPTIAVGDDNNDRDVLLSFSEKREKLVRIVQRLTSTPEGRATDFAKIACFEPNIPQVSMVHLYLRPTVDECQGYRDAVQAHGGVCLFHRIRPVDENSIGFQQGYRSMVEISIGQANGGIPDDVWVEAWSEFAHHAMKQLSFTSSADENLE